MLHSRGGPWKTRDTIQPFFHCPTIRGSTTPEGFRHSRVQDTCQRPATLSSRRAECYTPTFKEGSLPFVERPQRYTEKDEDETKNHQNKKKLR